MICLAAAGLVAALGAATVELSWTHSVERTVWRETWRAADGLVHLDQAAIRGTGAGMEMPADARLVDGWYIWQPRLPPRKGVLLTRSGATADYTLCVATDCRPLLLWLPADAPVVELRACG